MNKNVIIIILTLLALCLVGYILWDKILQNNTMWSDNSGYQDPINPDDENRKKLYLFLKYEKNEIVGVTEEGLVTKITSGSQNFYLDDDLLYWVDNAVDASCNGEHNLYRVNINNKNDVENMNVKLDMCSTGFSVVGDNLYYFSKINDKIMAITRNLKTGVSKSREVPLTKISFTDFSNGSTVLQQ